MLSVSRSSWRLVSTKAPGMQAVFARGMSMEGVKGLNEHEQAVENMYFNKEEERLLRTLLKKVKGQADQDQAAAAQHAASEAAALRQIIAKYDMKESDVKALLEWKHSH